MGGHSQTARRCRLVRWTRRDQPSLDLVLDGHDDAADCRFGHDHRGEHRLCQADNPLDTGHHVFHALDDHHHARREFPDDAQRLVHIDKNSGHIGKHGVELSDGDVGVQRRSRELLNALPPRA